MADIDVTREKLIACLREVLPGQTHGAIPKVLGPSDGRLRKEATLPYNLRLADSIGPLALVYPQTAQEISAAVQCAKECKVPAVPRSGGHSYAAYSLGGELDVHTQPSDPLPLLADMFDAPPAGLDAPIPAEPSLIIDMRAFRAIEYDSQEQTVKVGAGAMTGEMCVALEKVGRMVPCGSCLTVGVGGQAVSGGFGLMSRSQGLLLDNMLSAEVVLADGRLVVISESHYPDLFWGIRGGGPSLGIAHTFTFRTHPVSAKVIYFELVLLPRALPSSKEAVERATNLFSAFQEYGHIAPSKLGLIWHVAPDADRKGGFGTKVEVVGQWMGSEEEYEDVMVEFEGVAKRWGVGEFDRIQRSLTYLQSLRNVGGDLAAMLKRGPLNIHEHEDFYAKSLLTKEDLPMASITAHLTHLLSLSPLQNPSTDVDWFVLAPYLGGKESLITKQTDTAFGHRDLKIVWEFYAKKPKGAAQGIDLVSFVKRIAEDLGPVQAKYPAYADPELTASEYPRLIWGDAYPRLQSLKAQYDPTNVFRYPQSVRVQSVPDDKQGDETARRS